MGKEKTVKRKKNEDSYVLAVIGAGNMGSALIRGITKTQLLSPKNIIACDVNEKALLPLKNGLKIQITKDPVKAVKSADVVLLAVKPVIVPSLLQSIHSSLRESQLLLSIVAGLKIHSLESLCGRAMPIVRVMPNIAATVGMSATAIAVNGKVTHQQQKIATKIFESVGTVVSVGEEQLDAVTGLSGSGPAYIFLLIEALIDGGVKMGLPRTIASPLAIQTALGAATMVKETQLHPAILRDLVTTPGGTTIQGIHVLETKGFRSTLMEAVAAATRRSQELSEPSKKQ
ncbi:MAG TPA: pyrroline-5-carboxylate reductase [Bacteroidota bacterium]|nr:pyrroline-5-carboxylate reductase [Bacteroidota bacterium]